MSVWSGKLPDSIFEPISEEQKQQNKLLHDQLVQQRQNERIASEAQALVRKVENAIEEGGGTPQSNKAQYNYGVKGKYLDCVVSAACSIWSGKGSDYSYRYKNWKKDWEPTRPTSRKTSKAETTTSTSPTQVKNGFTTGSSLAAALADEQPAHTQHALKQFPNRDGHA